MIRKALCVALAFAFTVASVASISAPAFATSTLVVIQPFTVNGHVYTRGQTVQTGDVAAVLANPLLSSDVVAVVSGGATSPPPSGPDYAFLQATPAATTNGAPIMQALPAGATGVSILVNPGGSISYTINDKVPTGAPAAATVKTFANPSSATNSLVVFEPLAGTQMVYITAGSGAFIAGNSVGVPSSNSTASGGGSVGSVTAAGTNGSLAQAVQGITGGVPIPISGSVSATTAFPYNSTGAQAAVSASALAAAGVYVTSPPTLTNGQVLPLRMNANGAAIVDGSAVTQPVSLGALPALVGGTANIGTTGTTSAPNVGQLVDGTTPTQKAAVSAGGALKVDGSAVTQPVSGSVAVNQPYSGTSSGQTATANSFVGHGCIFNTAAPTLTNGQFAPCQSDANGNLKTVASSVTFPYTFAPTQTATAASFLGVGGYDGTNFQPVHTSTVGGVNIAASGLDLTAGNGGDNQTNPVSALNARAFTYLLGDTAGGPSKYSRQRATVAITGSAGGIGAVGICDPTASNCQGVDVGGVARVATGGSATASVATGAANTVVKASAGRLVAVLITTVGTGATDTICYDNAATNTGTIIGYIPKAAVVGTFLKFDMPAANGITCANVASGPVFTVSFF